MEVLYTLKKKEPGYLFRTQSYERFQVILVLHNELRIESNGSSGRLHPGDIALLRNGSAFSLSCPDGGYEGVGVELLRAEHAVFHGPAWWGHAGVVSLAMGRELKEQMERYQVTSHEYFHHLAVSFAWNSAMTDQTDRSENYPPQVWTERIKQQIHQTLGMNMSLENCLAGFGLELPGAEPSLQERHRRFAEEVPVRPAHGDGQALPGGNKLADNDHCHGTGFLQFPALFQQLSKGDILFSSRIPEAAPGQGISPLTCTSTHAVDTMGTVMSENRIFCVRLLNAGVEMAYYRTLS